MVTTCTRNGQIFLSLAPFAVHTLDRTHLLLSDVGRVVAKGELDGGLVEVGVAHDAEVLVVLLALIKTLLKIGRGLPANSPKSTKMPWKGEQESEMEMESMSKCSG